MLTAAGTLAVCLSGALAAAAPRPKVVVPPAAVSYERDVKPILKAKCYACHANGTHLGGFQIDSREGVLTGSLTTHPVVLPGKGAGSYLVRLVGGEVPGKIMPPKGARLSPKEVATLRAWVDQGVSFGSGPGAETWKPQLSLQEPKVPAPKPGFGLENPIDLLVQKYFDQHKPAPTTAVRKAAGLSGKRGSAHPSSFSPQPSRWTQVDDRTYARRVYLDLIGMLPAPVELQQFLDDRSPDKRVKLARKLLADDQRYAEHWLSYWNDLLRNDYSGTGYIDGGRLQITNWLYQALRTNKPYDKFVTELVNPTPESAGFVKGIVWRGVVNASQTPPMQASQSISQVFMGINLKCASCHDSFVSTWKLADAYGMAGIYADKPLEMVRCDKPTGSIAPVKFLYPQLGTLDGTAPREKRMEQLAGILTSKENGRLSRTLVNRLWARLMGRGLVEPVDEMDNRPWDPAVLDWLASDFVKNGYDIRKTLERIVTSRAYQLPAMALKSERSDDFVFAGPAVKRMSAEQYVDAVSSLTGQWSRPASGAPVQWLTPDQMADGKGAIRFRSGVLKSGSVEIDADVTGARYLSLVVTDGGNGANSDWADWVNPRLVTAKGETPLAGVKWHSATTGYGAIRVNQSVVQKPLRLNGQTYPTGLGTHATSIITFQLPEGATRFKALAGPDTGALEQGSGQTAIEMMVVASDKPLLEARAVLATADNLTRALGRPNREQVVTQRSPVATTLQALELTNGQTLATMLSDGAAEWMRERGGKAPAPVLVDEIYVRALGRPASVSEKQAALEILGMPVRKEGIEDLLWALTMLPEFQLIY